MADIQQSSVTVTVGKTTRTYYLWETTAPAAYDYGYTLHVYGDPHPGPRRAGEPGDLRLVLIPALGGDDPTSINHPQIMRYRTGLYMAEPSDLLGATGQGGLEEILWQAIHTLHRGRD